MIDIQLEELMTWMEEKYEQKYGTKFELLKKTFFAFFNLAKQIIDIYNNMYEQCIKDQLPSEDQIEPLRTVVNGTIIILHRLIENQKLINNRAGAIDLAFCEKFIKNFGENLNILCTYYHSMNHCELIANRFRFEKKKIVEGINKLYNIHTKIREVYHRNIEDLKSIEHQKLYMQTNIQHIIQSRELIYKTNWVIFTNVEQHIGQFFEVFLEMIRYNRHATGASQENSNLDTTEQTIKKLMRSYFRILHQFYQAQAELDYLIKPIASFCEEIKNKKKPMSYNLADSVNIFSRISTQLLKSNYSLKNFKKIRMEDFNKSLQIIIEQIAQNSNGPEFKQSSELLNHLLYKQLGIGIYGYGYGYQQEGQGKLKNNLKQKQREKEKQKQKDKEKEKEKEKEKQKNKMKQKQKGKNKQKGLNVSQSSSKGKSKGTESHNNSLKSKSKGKKSPSEDSQKNLFTKSVRQSKFHQFEQNQLSDSEQSSNQNQMVLGQRQSIQKKEPAVSRHSYEQQVEQISSQSSLGNKLSLVETRQLKIQLAVEEISECSIFIIDCMKQLQKVENSGLMNMIQDYKQKLNNTTLGNNNTTNIFNLSQYQNCKILVVKLCDYQKFLGDYYRLLEFIKQFQKISRFIILQEFKLKVNVLIDIDPQSNSTDSDKSDFKQKNKNDDRTKDAEHTTSKSKKKE